MNHRPPVGLCLDSNEDRGTREHFANLDQMINDVHLRLIGKCVVDFLLVLTEHFSLGVTAEAPRANIG